MRITKHGIREIALSAVVTGGLAALALLFAPGAWKALTALPLLLQTWVVSFFRDPARRVPGGEGLLVSPADGAIAEISEVVEETYLGCEAVKVGIFMSIFNVHVNRAPVSGRVEHIKYTRGKFLDARDPASSTQNENNVVGVKMNARDGKVLVKQISGVIARRIICDCRVGETLERGGRIGMIKFGSRVEVFVPKSMGLKILVGVGDRVKAGSSVLGEFP